MPEAPSSLKFGLDDNSWKILDQCLVQPLKKMGVQLWVFGSRARGDHKPFSDLDILFLSEKSIPNATLFLIKSDLEESRLSIKVDLVNASELAESYRSAIDADKVLI